MVDERVVMAASNNADLYEVMFESQGIPYERLPIAFVGQDRPPPYYSDITALSPDHVDEIVEQIRQAAARSGGPVGVKDGFHQLELGRNGFDVLFSASWIWRKPGRGIPSDVWQPVTTEAGLLAWEEAWKESGSPTDQRMFNDTLLHHPDVTFLGRRDADRYVAGCLANRSGTCVGLSNVFSRSPSEAVFAEATRAAAATAPDLPLVGYESGPELQLAVAAGFTAVGDLRILTTRNALF